MDSSSAAFTGCPAHWTRPGYAIAPGPVRVTDRCLVLVLAAVLGIGCTLGYLFGSSYRMDWQPADTSEQTQTTAIRQQLLDLGFPEAVLDDLTPEDIAACDGALRVVVETEDYPVNDGRNVLWETYNEKHERYYVQDTVYDVKELRLTSVGVQLPARRRRGGCITTSCGRPTRASTARRCSRSGLPMKTCRMDGASPET